MGLAWTMQTNSEIHVERLTVWPGLLASLSCALEPISPPGYTLLIITGKSGQENIIHYR